MEGQETPVRSMRDLWEVVSSFIGQTAHLRIRRVPEDPRQEMGAVLPNPGACVESDGPAAEKEEETGSER